LRVLFSTKKDITLPVLFYNLLLGQLSRMAEETIYINEVLEIMRTPNLEGRAIPFHITYRTFNRNSKTGGKWKSHKNAKLVMKEKGIDPHSVQALLHFKPSEKKKLIRKNPNHYEHKTRNIRLENGEMTKIHYKYIETFNGKNVLY